MTREEAAIVSIYTGFLIGSFYDGHKYAEKIMGRGIMTHEFASKEFTDTLRSAASNDFVSINIGAEKQPKPDAETGLVDCGCGGKPTFLYSYVARDDECCLECTRCEAKSALRLGEERARDSWNTAMGWRKQNDKG